MLHVSEPLKNMDADGMSEAWERAHGLNLKNRADASSCSLSSDYINVEVYLNSLVKNK